MPTDFDPTAWTLAEHGDSRQRHWAGRVKKACPGYEPFWQHHIVPLTFRPHQPDNYFLRPTQTKHLLALADASYAMFLHLTGAMRWSDWLVQKRQDVALRPTDCAYCFFSHTYSLQDATSTFANAVNELLVKYKQSRCFPVTQSDDGHSWRWSRSGVGAQWLALRGKASPYRNALVHERPLFVQTDSLPAPDRESIRELSGLTAIARLAKLDRSVTLHSLPAEQVLQPILRAAADLCDALWSAAREHLDAIDNPAYRRDQLRMRQEDQGLTLKRIRAARSDSRAEF